MEILGASIESLFEKCSRKFTLKTVLYLAVQMLERVKHVHERNLVHRDLKPDNFLTGYGETYRNKIFLIDFGLCMKYRSSSTKEHIPLKTGKSLTGTVRYASINAHKGYQQSRRDDLESLGYILIYFLKSKLPWQGLKAKKMEDKLQLILDKKVKLSIQDLCSNIPQEFAIYLEYCRNLKYSQEPDYDFLFSLFYGLIKKDELDPNLIEFDWFNLNKKTNKDLDGEHIQSPLNKSAIVSKNGVALNNLSLNVSNGHNLSSNDLFRKSSLVNGVRRKNTGVS